MKTLLATAALGLALASGAVADPIMGTWQTIKDDNGNSGHIKIAKCGSAICGTLAVTFDASGNKISSPHDGRKIIWDMQNEGGGNYGGGKVYSPDRDKTYNGQLVLSGNSLDVKGCVLGICRSGGTWKRVN